MCLVTDKRSIKRGKDLRTKSGHKVGWKVVAKDYNGGVQSRIMYRFKWVPGWNKSGRKSIVLSIMEKHSRQIDFGIHVYTSRRMARKMTPRWHNSGYKIVKVICYNKDCVAFEWDGSEAVYTKVFLPRQEWLHAIENTTRERK